MERQEFDTLLRKNREQIVTAVRAGREEPTGQIKVLFERLDEAIAGLSSGQLDPVIRYQADSCLREIAFMDACLAPEQRLDVGLRLLWRFVRHQDVRQVAVLFEIAPIQDYFLGFALAVQLNTLSLNTGRGPDRSGESE